MSLKNINAPAIEIRHLTKEYRLGVLGAGNLFREQSRMKALDDICLTVAQGETVGLIGRNGAGKSTLLKVLSRITAPSSGEAFVCGETGSVLEVGTGFHPDMTGRENIYLNGAILGMNKAQIKARMDQIISFSDLEEFIDTPVKHYSSGMYVRLAFAVAAHLDSDILILDEVLSVGDMEYQQKALQKMRELVKEEKRTILYVSHNLNTIRSLCSRCIVLEQGRIAFDGACAEAISYYTSGHHEPDGTIVYTNEHRPLDAYMRADDIVQLKQMKPLGRETASWKAGECALYELCFFSKHECQHAGLRFEIWCSDGSKGGSMMLPEEHITHIGENVWLLEMDTSVFSPGSYNADLVLYTREPSGRETILDAVFPGIMFEIKGNLTEETPVIWDQEHWGNFHLPGLRLTNTE